MDSSPQLSAQQFCLRWHNHQASLLSSLPLLLDQSHLTDVTLSAEGRTVRAHRVVLSACSSFFSELFRTLEPPFHPVVVLPGTSFGALVALLTFMYSGEVNVFEEQITTLLALAETLGIKGLADFHGNITKSPKSDTNSISTKDSSEIPSSPILSAHQNKITTSPYENIFNKSFQFYPSIIQQPLNFSQSSTRRNNSENNNNNNYRNQNNNKTSLEKTCNNNNNSSQYVNNSNNNINNNEENLKKTSNTNLNENNLKKTKSSDMRRIDKIAENLRCASTTKIFLDQHSKLPLIMNQQHPSSVVLKPPPLPSLPHHFLSDDSMQIPKTPESLFLETNQPLTQTMQTAETLMHEIKMEKPLNSPSANSAASKTANSKLYATCFICHKQLSNQYNLRVHLETHQNVRYACTVCTHVSRSKDALRKHVSYRHPGAPSPCDSETRRKRNKNLNQSIKQEIMDQTANALQQMIAGGPPKTINQSIKQEIMEQTASALQQIISTPPNQSPQQFSQQIPAMPSTPPTPPIIHQTSNLINKEVTNITDPI